MVDILQDLVVDVFSKEEKKMGKVGATEIVSGDLTDVFLESNVRYVNCIV